MAEGSSSAAPRIPVKSGGARWVSDDGLWTWTGTQWVASRSQIGIAARLAVYGAISFGVNLIALFILGLTWGLTGPAWDAAPGDCGSSAAGIVIASAAQIAITVFFASAVFFVGWLAIRIDRRDWWLGALLAFPWIAITIGLTISYARGGALAIAAVVVLASGLLALGPIVGRWQTWPSGRERGTPIQVERAAVDATKPSPIGDEFRAEPQTYPQPVENRVAITGWAARHPRAFGIVVGVVLGVVLLLVAAFVVTFEILDYVCTSNVIAGGTCGG